MLGGLQERLDLREREPEPLAAFDEPDLTERAVVEDAIAAFSPSGRSDKPLVRVVADRPGRHPGSLGELPNAHRRDPTPASPLAVKA